MTDWIRFKRNGTTGFGTLDARTVTVHEGDMFDNPASAQIRFPIEEADLLVPCYPGKMLAMWNNFHAAREKNQLPVPQHPWYFVKTANTFAPTGSVIRKPASCNGKILFEGELGMVIGKRCRNIPVSEIDAYIFGYTCINDVTALEHLFSEPDFAHWARAKNFDGFGIIGPCIATGLEPDSLEIRTLLIGEGQTQVRQDYPVSDMIFPPRELASRISHDLTLYPGDIIACGTSLGAGAMKDRWTVEIAIKGIGKLVNEFRE